MFNETTTNVQEDLRRYFMNTNGPFSDNATTTRIDFRNSSIFTNPVPIYDTYKAPEEAPSRMIPEHELRSAVAREVKFAVAGIIQKITDAIGELYSKEQVDEFLAGFQESMKGE